MTWGGAERLSPADDTLIRVERALDLDREGQLVASILSMKIAAGSRYLVLDLPVGPTAKVRSDEAASALSESLTAVARTFGIEARVVVTDGLQPVGRGVGPALEARDVLAVLQGAPDAPRDLRTRAVTWPGTCWSWRVRPQTAEAAPSQPKPWRAGAAWAKFQAICEAQGGMREPPVAPHCRAVVAARAGRVSRAVVRGLEGLPP